MAGGTLPPRSRVWSLPEADAFVAVGAKLIPLPRLDLVGTLHRAVYDRYLHPPGGATPEPLFYRGSLRGRRYTPKGGPAGLYLTYDTATAQAELRTVVLSVDSAKSKGPHDPVVTIAVNFDIHSVMDITDDDIRDALDLEETDLKADYETEQKLYEQGKGLIPVTQLLARAAHSTGVITALRYPSARTEFGINLVVFPDLLNPAKGDFLQVVDSTRRYAQRLP